MVGRTVEGFRKGIRSYPVIERHAYDSDWPGEAELANADMILDLHWARSPDWAFGGGTFVTLSPRKQRTVIGTSGGWRA